MSDGLLFSRYTRCLALLSCLSLTADLDTATPLRSTIDVYDAQCCPVLHASLYDHRCCPSSIPSTGYRPDVGCDQTWWPFLNQTSFLRYNRCSAGGNCERRTSARCHSDGAFLDDTFKIDEWIGITRAGRMEEDACFPRLPLNVVAEDSLRTTGPDATG